MAVDDGMAAPRALIVQPWFSAIGHPAQSTLNTAKALGRRHDVAYLVSVHHGAAIGSLLNQLESYGPVRRFWTPGDSLLAGTFLGVLAVARTLRGNPGIDRVLFLDAHLVLLAALWPWAALFLPSSVTISMIYLGGPERIASHPWARKFVSRYLASAGTLLYLRTDELAEAWRAAFPEVLPEKIETVPSLEIPEESDVVRTTSGDQLKLGIIGQVRPGKSLEWLLPLFLENPDIGVLHVAGAFTNSAHRAGLPFLDGYPWFDNRFLAEEEMLASAANQHYLIAMYEDWDSRMEAATVFLAARVGRPVIVYDEGWPGRVVRAFDCGVVVGRSPRPDKDFFLGLPRPGTIKYQQLLDGAARFREAHGGARNRTLFIDKFLAQR